VSIDGTQVMMVRGDDESVSALRSQKGILLIANLDPDAKAEDLAAVLSDWGEVVRVMIEPHHDAAPSGFVQFKREDAAMAMWDDHRRRSPSSDRKVVPQGVNPFLLRHTLPFLDEDQVWLISEEDSFPVNATVARRKCSLFRSNPSLRAYTVRSSVRAPAVEGCIDALNDRPFEIDGRQLSGLAELANEIGFDALAAKLANRRTKSRSMTRKELAEAVESLASAMLSDNFTFVINGESFHRDRVAAASLSPAVAHQLAIDACSRAFMVNDPNIEAADFR
jgi:hypothetical protein